MTRHAPLRLSLARALEAAGLAPDDEHVAKLVWVPFILHKRRAAVAPDAPEARWPMPRRCPLAAEAPTEGLTLAAVDTTAPPVFFPFWVIDTVDERVALSAIDGARADAPRADTADATPTTPDRDADPIQVIALATVGAMLLFNATYLFALAMQIITIFSRATGAVFGEISDPVLLRRADAPVDGFVALALAGLVAAAAFLLRRDARRILEPAIAEAASPPYALGRHSARLAKRAAVVITIAASLGSIAAASWHPLSVAGQIALGLGLTALAFIAYRISAATRDMPKLGATIPAPWVRDATNLLVVFAVTVLGTYALFIGGAYYRISELTGRPLESNDLEGALLGFVAAATLLTATSLPRHIRVKVAAALFTSVAMTPVDVPALTIVTQLFVVTVVSKLVEDERGERPSTREAIAQGLLTEAGIVGGVLFSRMLLTLLLGTLGWVLGEVAGECIGGVWASRRASDRATDRAGADRSVLLGARQ